MKQILVLQNQRIGDTLQTTPMLAGLRDKHDPCHIVLVTNRLFADLNLAGLADEIIRFDQNGLVEALRNTQTSVVHKYDQARKFLEPLCGRRFDLVIDVPADPHMHLLASMLRNPSEMRGAVLSPARTWTYSHPEVMLLYTIGLCREINRFNLVDLHNLLAAVRPSAKSLILPIPAEAERSATELLSEWGIDAGRDLVVALQPGASEERKRWGESSFAQLARLLVERLSAKVVLLGSDSERALGDNILHQAGAVAAKSNRLPIFSAIGRTNIAELAALLRQCALLVTNDTGTMHVAAAAGTRIIDICTGPVFFRESGPYAEGNIVIEPDIECSPCNFNAVCHHYSCRGKITPLMVLRIAQYLALRPDKTLQSQDFPGARLHRARFNDVGRLEFYPVFRQTISCFQFLSYFYAHTWEIFYGLRRDPKTAAGIVAEVDSLYDLRSSWKNLRPEVHRSLEAFEHLESEIRLVECAFEPLIPSMGLANSEERIYADDELQDVYGKLLSFGRARPAVRHFTAYLELAVESQAGAKAEDARTKIYEAFRFVRDQVGFLVRQLQEAAVLVEDGFAALDRGMH